MGKNLYELMNRAIIFEMKTIKLDNGYRVWYRPTPMQISQLVKKHDLRGICYSTDGIIDEKLFFVWKAKDMSHSMFDNESVYNGLIDETNLKPYVSFYFSTPEPRDESPTWGKHLIKGKNYSLSWYRKGMTNPKMTDYIVKILRKGKDA